MTSYRLIVSGVNAGFGLDAGAIFDTTPQASGEPAVIEAETAPDAVRAWQESDPNMIDAKQAGLELAETGEPHYVVAAVSREGWQVELVHVHPNGETGEWDFHLAPLFPKRVIA